VSPPHPSTEHDPRPCGEQEAHPLLTHRAPTEEENQYPTARAYLRVQPEPEGLAEITVPITSPDRPILRVVRGGPQVQIRSLREVRLCYPNGTELPVHWRLSEGGTGRAARWFIGADVPAGTPVETGMMIRAATRVLPLTLDAEPTADDWVRGGARA